nr:hypothetical protein [Tanacetum cinerariifolium]
MTDTQSLEEGVKRVLLEFKIQKRSSGKQNLSANLEGNHKSINGKRFEQGEKVWLGTIIGMIRENTSKKSPREQSEQCLENKIPFPSTLGYQLVDSPIILEALIEGFLVRRIYVDGGSSSEVMYKYCFRNLGAKTRAKRKESRMPLNQKGSKLYQWNLKSYKSHSAYNVILGQTGLRTLGSVAFTINSIIKFLTANGIATVTTKKVTLYECRRIKEMQGSSLEGRITFSQIPIPNLEGTTITSREESQGKTKEEGEIEDTVQPPPNPPENDTLTYEKIKGKDEQPESSVKSKPPEKMVIHDDYSNQTITIRGNLSEECRFRLIDIIRKLVNVFTWTLTDMTRIPRFIAEHELKTYPHKEPRVQRNRRIASDKRKVIKKEVAEWFKTGIVRKKKNHTKYYCYLSLGLGEYSFKGTMSTSVPEEMSRSVPEGMSRSVPEGMSRSVPKGMSRSVLEGMSRLVLERMSRSVPEGISRSVHERMRRSVPS